MRINMGGSGSSGDTQTYDAEELITAANAHAKHYQTLRAQFNTLRTAFQQISGLGSNFQGHGADAIKAFYSAQVNVVDAWLRLIDEKIAYFQGVAGTIDDKNLGGYMQVHVPFLNEDLSMGYARSKEMVREQRDDIAKILSSISDLVPINVFSNHEVDQALDAADKKRAQTALDVQDLDQNLTNEYRQVNEDLPYIASLYGELITATRQGADIQPMNFNAQTYHDSKIYHVQDEMKKETKNYLHYKQEQETVRKMEKQSEAEVNRPWYQKAGATIATFAGELSGYYDYLRAVEGIDPETGRKLSAGERVAAGAMAASTFIPIIGWGGRIAKGGAAIYKTARGMEVAGHALNAYDQASRTVKVLSQSEKGINALLAANGITQAATGRDLFGKQLTKDEQKNSLLQGVFMMNLFTRKLAISPAQKAIVHEQGQAFRGHVSKIVRDTKASVSANQWKPAMAGVPNDFTKMSNGAEDITKTHSMEKVDRVDGSFSKGSEFHEKVKSAAIYKERSNKGYAFAEDWERHLARKYGATQVENVTKNRISSLERAKLNSWNWPPSDNLYLKYKHVYNNDLYFNQVTGAPRYPNNNGFVDAWPNITHMEKGQLIDRFGSNGSGKYFSPTGTPFKNRALPPFMENQPYTKYKIIKPFKTYSGEITPWFDQLYIAIQ
ncbi:T7SS effector LXG polymorphic toxin [Sporolactobacillus sp. STCC-11]|uniref:T7SS effector LXG polymorphic toxin n=1 Tax=Sporolactobacillus caesalpiniae TaxID=3230362 RepID=UPI0033984CB6